MYATGRLGLTLAILKPDLMARSRDAEAVRRWIVRDGFLILRSKVVRFSLQEAKAFYSMHSGKEFFNRLTRSMCEGPFNPMILAHYNAIQRWRDLMGPTKRANILAPETIRAFYTTTETKNAVHGADSDASVKREIKWFFPDFSFEQWERDEPLYRTHAKFNEKDGLHYVEDTGG